MAGDPQRRLESLMSKLSQTASPRLKKPLFSSDGIGRKKAELGLRVSTSSIGSVAQCRPWDRGDLMRRLATFKAMTWFGKAKAQKIISLCGWEPCLLPYAVDGEDKPSESSGEILGEQRNGSIICTSDPNEVEGGNSNRTFLGENQYDPSSAVLDCRLCGARVGLWAFATVESPLEYFTLIVDLHGQNGPGTKCMDVVSSLEASKAESSSKDHQNIGSTSKERPLGLNLTIAGGPPPTKQNFRPVVSFPIISRHLRAEFVSSSCTKDHLSSELSCENHENSQFNQQKDVNGDLTVSLEDTRLLKRKRDENEFPVSESNDVNNPSFSRKEFQVLDNGGTANIVNSEEIMHRTAGASCRTNTNSEGAKEAILQTEGEITNNVEARESMCMTSNANLISRDSKADENSSVPDLGDNFNSHESTSKLDSSDTGGTSKHNHDDPLDIASCPDTNATQPTGTDIDTGRGDRSSNLKDLKNEKANYQTTISLETMLPTSDKEKADHGLGNNPVPPLHRKLSELDPIRQHRPFCPWFADGESLPGWRLTLNALIQQEKVSSSDPVQIDSPSNLIDEADDPVVSIRKLFMSPPTKRLKGTR